MDRNYELEHAHQKYKGLINGELAKQLYFLQNTRKEEEKLIHDEFRFKNGAKDMRKKLSIARKRRKKAASTLVSEEEKLAILEEDNQNGMYYF